MQTQTTSPALLLIEYLVTRNGAAWKQHATLANAIEHASGIALNTAWHQEYQGFDDNGRSAIVSRPVVVQIERMRWENNGVVNGRWETRWVREAIERQWMAGVEVEL